MGKRVICIDAGHYGKYNRSPVVKNYYESDMNWKLHLLLKKYLEAYGFKVITTRSSQKTDRGLYNRGYAAKGCDLFLSIHSNACAKESVDYPVVYRAYDNKGNSNELAVLLAKIIEDTMKTNQKGRTAIRRGASGGEYYGVLRGARAAGLSNYYILEHSFHTNTAATKWLLEDENLDKLAEAEAGVIAKYYGITKQLSDTEEYKVRVKADALNIRAGAGAGYKIVGQIKDKGVYTIVDTKNGWGKLKSDTGWVFLNYTEKV
ncbi:N-acetylmuramoyl-L-alanine amidase [Anaeromicropila populeti]|uniref:N-acetylmuramoyl-L-alanine amidase n=1 Tax=Anaeromicropila populeti TaxID=37658 RepID=A0A1I6LPA9_9FIRM|nr:N-acetylmuramoyl-L-alanine amidase [Anaeromicropila populeti]SFS05305.1 N-acetylmuramoyl-L-alanine amidase [Anaeromicropila populeti]